MAVKTFILAAGLGTRLRPYTHILPKPAIPFLGIPMLGYAMYLSDQSEFKSMVFNTHVFPEKIQKCVELINQNRFQTEFSHEDSTPMGSGGALFAAKKYLQPCSDFFVINGDSVFIPHKEFLLKNALKYHQEQDSLCTLIVSENPQWTQKFNPLWIDKKNHLLSVGAKPLNEDCRPAHYLGLKIFNQRIFKYIPAGVSNIFTDVLVPALQNGETVSVMPESGFWWETGNFDSFFDATKEAMSLIHTHKENYFFRNIYAWMNKDFKYTVLERGPHIVFLHTKSKIPSDSIKGSAFIDANTSCADKVQLENIIINQDCHANTNAHYQMIIKDVI